MTDDNALMGEPLSDAERLAYAEIYNGAHNTDHSMLGLKPGATCKRCESTARAVVAAVRGPIAAKALIDAAERVLDQADRVRVKFGSVQPSGWNRTYGLSEAASMLRADAQSLSLPASKETQQ